MSGARRTSRWRLACFDLDGTLVRGTSVSQHLADRFGRSEEMAELERRYAAGRISNSVVAAEQARGYRGIPLPQVVEKLEHEGESCVRVEISSVNQYGQVKIAGVALVAMP